MSRDNSDLATLRSSFYRSDNERRKEVVNNPKRGGVSWEGGKLGRITPVLRYGIAGLSVRGTRARRRRGLIPDGCRIPLRLRASAIIFRGPSVRHANDTTAKSRATFAHSPGGVTTGGSALDPFVRWCHVNRSGQFVVTERPGSG
jgi:hypothetical protein